MARKLGGKLNENGNRILKIYTSIPQRRWHAQFDHNLIDKDKNQLQLTTRRILSEILKP